MFITVAKLVLSSISSQPKLYCEIADFYHLRGKTEHICSVKSANTGRKFSLPGKNLSCNLE